MANLYSISLVLIRDELVLHYFGCNAVGGMCASFLWWAAWSQLPLTQWSASASSFQLQTTRYSALCLLPWLVWYSRGLMYLVFASLVLFMHADSMTFDGMDRIERCNTGYSATLNTWACKEAESDSFTVRICSRPTIDSNLSPFLPSHYIPIMDHLSKGTFLMFLLTHSIWFLSCLLDISKGTC